MSQSASIPCNEWGCSGGWITYSQAATDADGVTIHVQTQERCSRCGGTGRVTISVPDEAANALSELRRQLGGG